MFVPYTGACRFDINSVTAESAKDVFIAPDGKILHVLGSGRREEGPDKFATPEGVEIRGNTIWFSDSGNDRVVKYVIKR